MLVKKWAGDERDAELKRVTTLLESIESRVSDVRDMLKDVK